MPILNGKQVSNEEVLAWLLNRPRTDQIRYMIQVTKRQIRQDKKDKAASGTSPGADHKETA